jgi:hypothetical protein
MDILTLFQCLQPDVTATGCRRLSRMLNFRDAIQYWGLEDFINVTPTGVTNATNLALCMVNMA